MTKTKNPAAVTLRRMKKGVKERQIEEEFLTRMFEEA